MLCESCTERGNSSVQEAGEDGYGSGKVTYISGIMWIYNAESLLQPPRSPHGGCLSVCRISLGFFSGGGEMGVRTTYCKGNRDTGSNRRMW